MRWFLGLAPLCALAVWWWLGGPKVVHETTSAPTAAGRSASAPWARAKQVPQRRAALVGRVFDPDGGPLPGAVVVVVKTPIAEGAFATLEPLAVLRSDQDGRFRVEQLGLVAEVMVSATAHGWAGAAMPATLRPTDEASVELRLLRGGGTFYGRVTDGPDAPVSAAVRALGGNDAVYQVECDRDGRYELTLPVAAWSLAARADGYDPWWQEDAIVLGDRDRIRVDIELAPETSIRARVCDADGKPVAGATVFAGEGTLVRVGISDERGEYVIRHPDASMRIAASLGGRCWHAWAERPPVGESIVTLRMSEGRNLRARVDDEEGRPVAGATITVNDDTRFVSGLDGRVEIAGLCQRPHDIVVSVDGQTRSRRIETTASEDLDLVFVIRRVYRFRLTVLDEQSRPVPRARVWIESGPTHTDSRGQLEFTASRGTVHVENPRTGKTEFGLYEPSETVVNEIEVRFQPVTTVGHIRYRDGSPAAHVAVHVDHNVTYTAADGSFPLGDSSFDIDAFVVEKDDSSAVIERADQRITGRIVDPDGQPVWGATIRATPEAELVEYGQMNSVRSGADGHFVITGLAAGNYGLVARHPDFEDATLIEQPAGSTVTMRFAETTATPETTEEPLVN